METTTNTIDSVKNGINIETSVELSVAPAQVFEFWRALENFPRFMTHVQNIKATAPNRYAWTVTGPAGTELSWEADVTKVIPDHLIAWKSVGEAEVENAGEVRFEPSSSGGTHLHVQLSYAPPMGVLGHAVATLFGKNPKQQMDDDLQRCKSLLEEGMTDNGVELVTKKDVDSGLAAKVI